MFSQNKKNIDGLQVYCKSCCSEYARLRRLSNPETMAKWRKENVEKIRASRKAWNQAHPEKVEEYKIQCIQYYKDNPEKKKVKDKKYRESHKEKVNAMTREWRKDNPKAVRRLNLKQYGITQEDYDDMYIEQGGCCAICGIHQSKLKLRLGIDHCHKTGTVRGLLCNNCNTALGLMKDNMDIMRNAIEYLGQSIDQDWTAE